MTNLVKKAIETKVVKVHRIGAEDYDKLIAAGFTVIIENAPFIVVAGTLIYLYR